MDKINDFNNNCCYLISCLHYFKRIFYIKITIWKIRLINNGTSVKWNSVWEVTWKTVVNYTTKITNYRRNYFRIYNK